MFSLAAAPQPSVVRSAHLRRCQRVVARAGDENKVVREYSEGSDSVSVPEPAGRKKGEKNPDGTFYIDEIEGSWLTEPCMQEEVKKDVMSDEMKRKLRDEYVAWGGTPSKPLSNNYFLYIIVIISALAVAAKLSGALDMGSMTLGP